MIETNRRRIAHAPRAIHAAALILLAGHAANAQIVFTDGTDAAGLGGISTGRVCLADLNNDGRPDAIVDRKRIYLNTLSTPTEPGAAATPSSLRFVEVANTGLPEPRGGDCLVFADLDNDGFADAILARSLDINNKDFTPPPEPSVTSWFKGRGDGTFGEAIAIVGAPRATTAAIAVGDVDRDGLLDLYVGNWYTAYGTTNEAFPNDLLLQRRDEAGAITWTRVPLPEDTGASSPEAGRGEAFADLGGRPTYGVMIVWMFDEIMNYPGERRPQLLELNYGRRANRLWSATGRMPDVWRWTDEATRLGLDGDAIRHGKYPDWLKERAKTDPRFARADELPFRSHGNTFDASIGDLDGDGRFEVALAEIRHGWAGESSDPSRVLAATGTKGGVQRFEPRDAWSLSRSPRDASVQAWNEGDLFCEMADFDNDGRLDLLLSSGDYPDNQRLRVFRQLEDGSLADVTPWSGLNNEGSQQISLGDVDLDGDVDVLVGQTFNRLGVAQIAGRTPSVKLYLNQAVERRAKRKTDGLPLEGVESNSITLRLIGDPTRGVARDALGAVVAVRTQRTGDGEEASQWRQLIAIGGHAGKQHEMLVHIGLGGAAEASSIQIQWPDRAQTFTTLNNVSAGRHTIELSKQR
jgi:hypothetical protein